jgi:hypothetical protein
MAVDEKPRSGESWHKGDDGRVPDGSSFLGNGPSVTYIIAV